MRELLFTLLIIQSLTDQERRYFVPQMKTWKEAIDVCRQNGDVLAGKNDILCRAVPGEIFTNKSDGITIWTGDYRTVSKWISKIEKIEVESIERFSSISVDDCFSRCLTMHRTLQQFAYKNQFTTIQGECACLLDTFGNSINRSKTLIDTNKSMWLYKVLPRNSFTGNGNCVAINCSNNESTIQAVDCLNNNMYKPYCYPREKTSTWFESDKKCLHKEIDLPGLCSQSDDDLRVWLDIHRIQIDLLNQFDDKIENDTYIFQCRSLTCHSSSTKKDVITSCDHKTEGFFCINGTNIKETMVSKSSTATTFLSTDKRTYTGITGHYSTTKGFLRSIVTTYKPSFWTSQSSNFKSTTLKYLRQNNINYIIGGVIGGCITITTIAISVVICKRRKVCVFKEDSAHDARSNVGRPLNINLTVTANNNFYNSEDMSSSSYYHSASSRKEKDLNATNQDNVYAVVVKKGLKDNITDKQSEKTGFRKKAANPNEIECQENVYDRINRRTESNETVLHGNLYDTSLGIRCESDPTYNSTVDREGPKSAKTYDHL